MNRVILDALNGSETAIRTMNVYSPVIQKSIVSDAAKPSNLKQSENDRKRDERVEYFNYLGKQK